MKLKPTKYQGTFDDNYSKILNDIQKDGEYRKMICQARIKYDTGFKLNDREFHVGLKKGIYKNIKFENDLTYKYWEFTIDYNDVLVYVEKAIDGGISKEINNLSYDAKMYIINTALRACIDKGIRDSKYILENLSELSDNEDLFRYKSITDKFMPWEK